MKKRDIRKEIEELGIISIEGSGLLTEKAVFAAIDAIKASNNKRSDDTEWQHIEELQAKKAERMQGAAIG